MIKDLKGFFSIDAFFAFMLLITVSTLLLTMADSNQNMVEETVQIESKDMAVEKLAAAMNTVYANGSALTLSLELPDNVMGENYVIISVPENREVFAENTDKINSKPIAKAHIIPKNFNEFTLKPENLENTIRISWKENMIKVKNIG